MAPGSDAAGSKVDFARIGLGIGDELGDRFDRKRWMDSHHIRYADDRCNGSNVPDEIEIGFVIERRIVNVRGSCKKQRVAVWRRIHDHFGGNITASSRPIFDDERLAETL